ncbi:tetratricopeptide repeat protein [Methylovirgula sp. 4M-Z18]|nr:tetratricopeptide repeat protein [Methylovirgula sp. 4M-Z18]
MVSSASLAFAHGGGGGSGGGGGGGGSSGGGSGGGGTGGGASGGGGSASGGGASSGSGGSSGHQDLTTCAQGMVWDAKNHVCLMRHSGVLPDYDLTEYAFALAKAKRYQEALDTLDTLQNPDTPRALNYRGYATRKLGRTEEGIAYYQRSVELDPNYTQVREYLGEAYVTLGKFDDAREQLATIEKLCGSKACEEYEELSDAIAKGNDVE